MSSSKLTIGIVGLPNIGKSTLFNALTKKRVPAENYPFCTIDPSVGVVAVPDERLEKLAAFSRSAKVIPAAVEFVDIAGLVKGAAEGEGLGNQFLAHIREVDAIAHVVRVFEDANIAHVEGRINPVRDVEVVETELALADAETVRKRRAGIEREARRGEKAALAESVVLERVAAELDVGRSASSVSLPKDEARLLASLHLLTMKPVLFVLNTKTGSESGSLAVVREFLAARGEHAVVVDVGIEQDMSESSMEERSAMRREFAPTSDGVDGFIRAGYELLGLITFFTTGEDEPRGWTIRRGANAPEAGAAIHTDFREKFIRAEVINWHVLLAAGSYAAARERGLLRTEGKQYVVEDGDVIEFKI